MKRTISMLTIALFGAISCVYRGVGGDDTVTYPAESKVLSVVIAPENGWNKSPQTAPIYEVSVKSTIIIEIRRYDKILCVDLYAGGKHIYPPADEYDCGRDPISVPHDVKNSAGTESICIRATVELPSVISEQAKLLNEYQDQTRGQFTPHENDLGQDGWLEEDNDKDLYDCLEFGVATKSVKRP